MQNPEVFFVVGGAFMLRVVQNKLGWLFFLLIFSLPLSADHQPALKAEDVRVVMRQIFDQHLTKKEINEKIIRSSFLQYIEYFDPERVYLLESEVMPFISMSDDKVSSVLRDYRQDRFTEYENLNAIIQKAILRSRKFRETQIGKNPHIFDSRGRLYPAKDPEKGFAKTIAELKNRQKEQLVRFAHIEINRYGQKSLWKNQKKLITLFNERISPHENSYLYVNGRGAALNNGQKDNLMYFHVLKALTKSLDAHTSFMNDTEAFNLRMRLEKGYDGIGLILERAQDGLKIANILEDSPASASKSVDVGDVVLEINGEKIADIEAAQAMYKLRGKEGSRVQLLLKKPNGSFQKVALLRKPIVVNEGRVQTRADQIDGGIIGTIKLSSFYKGNNDISSDKDVLKAIKDLQAQGNLKGLILDLRENTGGFLSQAVKVAGLFITNGVVVVSKYSNGEERLYRDMDSKVSYQGPLVILTSKMTASAAEIVAQALQDWGVAIVVGDKKTYGKGTIQSQTVTQDKGRAYFKVTVGKYYTVSGKSPEVEGVKSDILVPSPLSLDQIGENPLDNDAGSDFINPIYQDQLTDIDQGLKSWYRRNYIPTMQKRNHKWQHALPELRKNSDDRMIGNRGYQAFLQEAWQNMLINGNHKIHVKEDLQHQEAVNIVKDMIKYDNQYFNQRKNLKRGARVGS